MTPQNLKTRRQAAAIAVRFALISAALPWGGASRGKPITKEPGGSQSNPSTSSPKDDILDAGAPFAAPENVAKPISVICIHGWGVNFHAPTYVAISNALARRGRTAIAGNTRMHDLGKVEVWRGEKRVRGGVFWGVANK